MLKLIRAAEVLDAILPGSFSGRISGRQGEENNSYAYEIAGLPLARTIEEYDLSFHSQLDKKEGRKGTLCLDLPGETRESHLP